MGIVSNAILIISGVYLALGLIYLRFWWAERAKLSFLAFTISCLSYAIYAWFELGMIHAGTPEQYLFYIWWAFVVGGLGITAFAWFAYLHLQGRKWLFLIYAAMRGFALVLHLIMANGVNFRQITSVGTRSILGETLSYPVPVPNPWMVIPHLSHVVLIILLLDASVRSWRRGEHRTALIFGTGTILFGMVTLIVPTSVLWGFASIPLFSSYYVLFMVIPMLYELNYDMHRAAMLTETLAEREARLTETLDQLQLSAAAANVGMWTRRIGQEKMWVSEKAGEIWGFPKGSQFARKEFFEKVHPDDREMFFTNVRELDEGKNEFHLEYRVMLPDGNFRWIHSRGKVEPVNGDRFIRGALVDITKLKMAEEAIHELSGRLINAQEKERARLARELHDDLSQRIALHSIHLGTLRNDPKDLKHVQDKLEQFVEDVDRLSVDVHRISHELHPAILNQLGLVAAVQNFCEEMAGANPVEIDFEAHDLPRDLREDVSLCLYRVTQESLQNIIKHSGASSARVSIKKENDEVSLSISDNGDGFDTLATKAKEALGLISIDERVRTVKGEVKVTSAVGAGTQIEVRVPVTQLGQS